MSTVRMLMIFLCLSAGLPATRAATAGEFDLRGFIDQEIKAGKQRIVVPPGSYRVVPENREHLALRNLENLEIIADGVEMICTETTRALTISHCKNVSLRGLAIDNDPLPFTQGRITGFADNKRIHEIELFEGYPPAETARNFKYEIFRPDTRTLRCEDRGLEKIEVVDSRRLRLIRQAGKESDEEQVGDLIVIGTEYAPHGSAAHAIECSHNTNVRLENISLFASNCFGFLEYDCDASIYQNCSIDRRPAATDPVKRADPRLRSLNADAYHSKHAIKGPSYRGCTAAFMGDDSVNICGDYHMIMASQGRELRVLAKHDLNIQPGDPVEIVAYDGKRLPDAKAISIRADGAIRDDERAFLLKQRMNESLRTANGALTKAFTITLDHEADIAMGGVICSANRIGNGFVVKDCKFGFNRSRGVLIKASYGEISGNHIANSRMSAILVSPEYWWLEAGSSSNLKITNNTITDCGGVPILVQASGGNGNIAPPGAHSDISISGNRITRCPVPGILVTSTAGLRMKDNTFESSLPQSPLPNLMRQAGLKDATPIVTLQCLPE